MFLESNQYRNIHLIKSDPIVDFQEHLTLSTCGKNRGNPARTTTSFQLDAKITMQNGIGKSGNIPDWFDSIQRLSDDENRWIPFPGFESDYISISQSIRGKCYDVHYVIATRDEYTVYNLSIKGQG